MGLKQAAHAAVSLVEVPPGARIQAHLPGAHFHDAWAVATPHPERTALAHFLVAARATPAWVEACMRVRNLAVRPLGLKPLGAFSSLPPYDAADYRVGQRVGIFTLFEIHPDEVLLGDRDRHLDVILSVHRAGPIVTVTTVVHRHNLLGRLYLLPVLPMHRRIVPAVLRTLAHAP